VLLIADLWLVKEPVTGVPNGHVAQNSLAVSIRPRLNISRCESEMKPQNGIPHNMSEPHTKNGRYLHDFVLGFADGLTVPFALTTGFAGLGSQRIVIIAGVAELLSGAISMGLGAYLAALTDRQVYHNELRREQKEVEQVPVREKEEIFDILCSYGPERDAVKPFVDALCRDKDAWIKVRLLASM
jgi:hypothetical protein